MSLAYVSFRGAGNWMLLPLTEPRSLLPPLSRANRLISVALYHQTMTSNTHWGSLQLNVKRSGWESAHPHGSLLENEGLLPPDSEFLPQVKEFNYLSVLREQLSVRSAGGLMQRQSSCRCCTGLLWWGGNSAVDLPVDPHSNPQIWSWTWAELSLGDKVRLRHQERAASSRQKERVEVVRAFNQDPPGHLRLVVNPEHANMLERLQILSGLGSPEGTGTHFWGKGGLD